MTIPRHSGALPYISTEQMIEVDRAMIDDYGIELVQMMENAGRNLARLSRERFLGGDPRGKRIVVLAGTGGNGGGALACGRNLHNWGAEVVVVTTRAATEFTEVPRRQLGILRNMGVRSMRVDGPPDAGARDLIIDGIIGYSLRGAPRGPAADLIRWSNSQPEPVLALDAPSGIDTTTGAIRAPAIEAVATMTLALPKHGLRADGAPAMVGELYLADIGVPSELYSIVSLGLEVGPVFAESDILQLW